MKSQDAGALSAQLWSSSAENAASSVCAAPTLHQGKDSAVETLSSASLIILEEGFLVSSLRTCYFY